KTSVSIAKSLDGRYFGLVAGKTYNLLAIESHEKISKDFDLEKKEVQKLKYKPPMSHPWKAESFAKYLIV
ncbi:MAG: ISNCY family transposase, partial [Fusobacteriaceae bacterium]